jgi:hypothetical protein
MQDVTLVMCLSSPPRGNLEAVDKRNDFIDWNEGRDGYVPAPGAVTKAAERQFLLRTRTEELLGSLLAGAGTIWATYVATQDYASLWHTQIMPPGPVEVCALGILVWLHAKWRRSLKAN